MAVQDLPSSIEGFNPPEVRGPFKSFVFEERDLYSWALTEIHINETLVAVDFKGRKVRPTVLLNGADIVPADFSSEVTR